MGYFDLKIDGSKIRIVIQKKNDKKTPASKKETGVREN